MGNAINPLEQGVIASYAHPGGNVTGEANPSFQLASKRIQILRELVPHLTRLGVLWEPENSSDVGKLQIVQKAAADFSVDIVPVPVSDPEGLAGGLLGVTGGRVDAVYVFA
jgi:putative ABC transport system substrate-binding protein